MTWMRWYGLACKSQVDIATWVLQMQLWWSWMSDSGEVRGHAATWSSCIAVLQVAVEFSREGSEIQGPGAQAQAHGMDTEVQCADPACRNRSPTERGWIRCAAKRLETGGRGRIGCRGCRREKAEAGLDGGRKGWKSRVVVRWRKAGTLNRTRWPGREGQGSHWSQKNKKMKEPGRAGQGRATGTGAAMHVSGRVCPRPTWCLPKLR